MKATGDSIKNLLGCSKSKMNLARIILLDAVVFMLVTIVEVSASGATSYPVARQYQCFRDGGYLWPPDGSAIPNRACQAAFRANNGSTYPFERWDDISATVIDPSNTGSLERTVPDGLLCAGGDERKRGLDLPANAGWHTTLIKSKEGSFTLRWEITALDVPSTLSIFISKPSYDRSQPLHWEDLQQVHYGVTPNPVSLGGYGSYDVRIALPNDYQSDAVIYSYLQQTDTPWKAFFSCSDVRILR
ncbi:hypothetical protein EC973_007426 [Apophysomyces ossiformis]|uniref:Chitin-binding type-4 domain-containing protein n=1 Tax=Apophysomyces ossiformis TaxID=679940 RepID=A0A8H7BRZ7_9FUNG|nr:hypothetical protein EC973_007404 [Apophysomyces ossiformis]KAF7727552.1 hypothetical protein EC973_007426 [Apophysomyces ossiformis]